MTVTHRRSVFASGKVLQISGPHIFPRKHGYAHCVSRVHRHSFVNKVNRELAVIRTGSTKHTFIQETHGITSTRCYGVTPRRPCARCSEAQWSRDPVANTFARRSIRSHCVVTRRRVMLFPPLLLLF